MINKPKPRNVHRFGSRNYIWIIQLICSVPVGNDFCEKQLTMPFVILHNISYSYILRFVFDLKMTILESWDLIIQ